MAKMRKGLLTQYLIVFINLLDEQSADYARFCDILLTCMGMADADGNLTDEYRKSDYWTMDDEGFAVPDTRAIAEFAASMHAPS